MAGTTYVQCSQQRTLTAKCSMFLWLTTKSLFLTDLSSLLGINACYRVVLCLGILLTLVSTSLRQSCCFCTIFSHLFEIYICSSNGPAGKGMQYVIYWNLVAIFLLSGYSIFCWQVICAELLSECRPLVLDLNIPLLNFTAENKALGTVSGEWRSSLAAQAIPLPLCCLIWCFHTHMFPLMMVS